jgi:dimethylargininase
MKSTNFTAFAQPRCACRVVIQRYKYTFAIARQLPDSFPDAVSMDGNSDDARAIIDMERAKEQHETYVQVLRQCVPVLELPAASRLPLSSNLDGIYVGKNDNEVTSTVSSNYSNDNDDNIDSDVVTPNDYPDCAFVEDTVVAIGQQALITRMGHISRRGEGDAISSTLQQLGMDVLNMNDYYNSTDWIYGRGNSDITGSTVDSAPVINGELATVDGGDVLYTERHIYVGLSDRTNIEGAIFIRQYFSSYEVILVPKITLDPSIKLTHPIPLHLKSAVTHIDSYTLLAPTGPYGDYLLEAMNVEEFGYKVYRVPDLLSCNVISCNGHVIVQDTLCEQSQEILSEAVMNSDQDLIQVNTSELAKKDAALTCCSVLLEI